MTFPISTKIITLTICFDGCAKGIIGVGLDRFQYCIVLGTNHRNILVLVGIKHNVFSFRKIVRIHSHAFEIMCIIHEDANLRIMTLSKIEISNTTTNLDHAVLINAAIFCITHCYTRRIEAGRPLKLSCDTCIGIEMIVSESLNLVLMLIGVFLVKFRFSKNGRICLLARIRCILNAYAISLIAIFGFKNISSLVKLAFCNPKNTLGTLRNINHTFAIDFIFEGLCNLFGTANALCNTRIENRANGRFIQPHFSAYLGGSKPIFF